MGVKRVLMTADTVGGVWTYSLDLARWLGEREVSVVLATMGAPISPDQARDAADIPTLELKESNFRLEWMSKPWTDVDAAGDWLMELEEQTRPDVIHLNNYAHGDLPWRAPTLVVAHSCVVSWWQAVKGEAPPKEWDAYAIRVRRGLSAVRHVVAPTHAMLDSVRKHYGPLRSAGVIPNARESKLFGAGPKKPFVLAAGRLWDEAKNVAALDKAAASVSWPVFVAGDGSEFETAKPLGWLSAEELQGWFCQASIYALPARYEPFGLSVLEAALSGCALVLGDIPSLRENWDGAAIFVPPDDTDALAHAINALTDPEALIQAGEQASKRAQRFDPAVTADAYLATYDSLAVRRGTEVFLA